MVSPDWVSAGFDVVAAIGTVGTLFYAVRAANASTREDLRIQFFKTVVEVPSDHPGILVQVNSLVFTIENLGVQPVALVEGALWVRQQDGKKVPLYIGLPASPQPDLPHRRPIVIKPGNAYQGSVTVYLDEIKKWLPNRAPSSLWFDCPLLRLQTSRGKVFKHRLSEQLWRHLQSQHRWERHCKKYPLPPPDPDFEDEYLALDEDPAGK